jgi:hypothetical protein
MKTGIAHLPLHGGKAPAWLFSRMKHLAAEIVRVILYDFGTPELLRRLSDPFWFQVFGCILGFDWHSSGLTTTACGALKEGLKGMEHELGFFVSGGKGRVSRRTPDEILARGETLNLVAQEGEDNRKASTALAGEEPKRIIKEYNRPPKPAKDHPWRRRWQIQKPAPQHRVATY